MLRRMERSTSDLLSKREGGDLFLVINGRREHRRSDLACNGLRK